MKPAKGIIDARAAATTRTKDEAADNKQIRFGSKIYLISFYWPKSKADGQTDRQRERERESLRRQAKNKRISLSF